MDIRNALSYKNGTITVKEDVALYEDSAAEEKLDLKTIKEVNKFNKKFITETTEAVAEMAVDEFNKDKKIDRIESNIEMVGGSVTTVVDRSTLVRTPGKEPEPKAQITVKVTQTAGKVSASAMSKIRTKLRNSIK